MSNSDVSSDIRKNGQELHGPVPSDSGRCSFSVSPQRPDALTSDLCGTLENAGCPLAPSVQDRLRFETLLAELSAMFVNVPVGEVDAQIESALRRIVEHLGLDRSGLGELAADGQSWAVTHSYQMPGIPPSTPIIPKDQWPWYTSQVQNGEVVRLCRLPEDLPLEAVREREYCLKVGLKSNLAIPLRVEGSVVGGIGFASFRGYRDWPNDLIQRLRLIGEIFTNAVVRKRADEALQARERSLRQTREQLGDLAAKLLHAQEEERRRIAREMHDDWTQRLAVLGIDLAKLEKQLGNPESALPLLRMMQEQLVTLSEDVHALSRQLHPAILDDLGLVEALRSECASFTRREEISIAYHPNEIPPSLPKDILLCVYRVAQEALRNIAKHAAVDEACVYLVVTASELVLRVQDGGVGFDSAGGRSHPGLGLSSMGERVRLIQGKLSVTSALGKGTTVEARVPLTRSDS
jgi:two-component system, NarL family, sensor kinase